MFEIFKRHTPMFVTSDVKSVALSLANALGFDELTFSNKAMEIVPIFQTVRINEKSEFIVKSTLSPEETAKNINENVVFSRLRAARENSDQVFEKFVIIIKKQMEVDSYKVFGKGKVPSSIEKHLPRATQASKRPLVVFTSDFSFESVDRQLLDMDHPAVWLEDKFAAMATETDAYFAISPTLKIELALNRYKIIESFGDFSFGMVRF